MLLFVDMLTKNTHDSIKSPNLDVHAIPSWELRVTEPIVALRNIAIAPHVLRVV